MRASSPRARPRGWAAGLASLTLTLTAASARAGDPLGFYLGAAGGEGRVDAMVPDTGPFGWTHPAYELVAGLRPIPLLGAEVAYVDFGHPSHFSGGFESDVRMHGAAAFGMLYFPLPLIDVYLKAGLARLQSQASSQFGCFATPCPAIGQPQSVSRSNTSLAGGAGVQYKLGPFGVRGEYERFNAAGGNPSLWSLGATWTF
jgi:opacity protein-like surface antigen